MRVTARRLASYAPGEFESNCRLLAVDLVGAEQKNVLRGPRDPTAPKRLANE